ncbi:hypothetical protein ACHAPJ_002742 [Fusarium lateritium]
MDRRFDAQLDYVLNLVRDTVAPDAIPMANAIQDVKRLTKSMQKAKDKDYAEWLHEEKQLLDQKFAQLGSVDSHAERIYKEIEALRKDLGRVAADTHQDHTPKDHNVHTKLVAAITTLLTSLGDFAKGKQLDEMSRKIDDNTKRMEAVLAAVKASQNHDDLYQQNQRLEALVTQLQTEVSKLQAEADSDERAEFKGVCHQIIEENQALCERRERLDNLEQREQDIAAREKDLQEREKKLNERTQNTPDSRKRRREDSPKPAHRRNQFVRHLDQVVDRANCFPLVFDEHWNTWTKNELISVLVSQSSFLRLRDFLQKGSTNKWFCLNVIHNEGHRSANERTGEDGGCQEGHLCYTLAMVTVINSIRHLRLKTTFGWEKTEKSGTW